MVARILGSEDLGIFGVLNALGVTITPVLMVALPITIAKFIPEYYVKDKDSMNKFISTGITFLVITSIIGSALLFISSDFIALDIYQTPLLGLLFKITAVFLIISIMVNYGAGILQGFQEIKKMSIIGVIYGIVSLPLIYLLGIEF
jgi:O-antigen/teichoic acid export membrane protein